MIGTELYTENIHEYLKCDDVINFDDPAVSELAGSLFRKAADETEFIRKAYEFVRDDISHSADINATEQLAFPVRPGKGEQDGTVVCPAPDKLILSALTKHRRRSELWEDLPDKLAYKREEQT